MMGGGGELESSLWRRFLVPTLRLGGSMSSRSELTRRSGEEECFLGARGAGVGRLVSFLGAPSTHGSFRGMVVDVSQPFGTRCNRVDPTSARVFALEGGIIAEDSEL